jgi:hypothetical protein
VLCYRISSFITSMLPLFVYVIVKYFKFYPVVCSLILMVLVAAIICVCHKFYCVIGKNKQNSLYQLSIKNPTHDSSLVTNYLLANVLPIMCLDFSQINSVTGELIANIPVIVGGGLVFISLFLFYLDYKMDYCNPLLQIMRYHFYTADMHYSNGEIEHKCIVISRERFNYYTNNTAFYYKLYNGVFVYVKPSLQEECNG